MDPCIRAIFLVAMAACSASSHPGKRTTGDKEPGERESPPPTFIEEAPARLAALGDVHGDLKAARKALRLAGAIDGDDQWIGGELVVVQTGDQLDRGDKEEKILELFEDLAEQAHAAGGAFYSLLGNHEVMNVDQDFRYVTDGGWTDFQDVSFDPEDPLFEDLEPGQEGRAEAFRPGGPWASILAEHNVLMVIGDTAFVHGGILPSHVDFGLPKINRQTQQWMRGERDEMPSILSGDDAPIWTRLYSDEDVEPDCDTLTDTLELLDLERLVIGHTVHPQVNPACDGRVWRIDVGMSAYYGGIPMAVEITADGVTVLGD